LLEQNQGKFFGNKLNKGVINIMTKSNKAETLERLFNDFFNNVNESFEALEASYGVKGILDQIFGKAQSEEEKKDALKKSYTWHALVEAYEYAVEGIESNNHPIDIVLEASDILKLASSEMVWMSEEWDNIIAMGDGRFALDDGLPIELYKVALLADVDIRTVRNAISSGELITYKGSNPSDDRCAQVENTSARRWLFGRRNFKPTVLVGDYSIDIDTVSTTVAFGKMLTSIRENDPRGNVKAKDIEHSYINDKTLKELEAGLFNLPLDAALPVADFYRLDREKFLQCVMRVFFPEELQILVDAALNNDK